MYRLRFEFDEEGVPPKQMICTADGTAVVEVLDEPSCKLGGKLVETPGAAWTWEWHGPWSWEPNDWAASPLTVQILALLNHQTLPNTNPIVRDTFLDLSDREWTVGEWCAAYMLRGAPSVEQAKVLADRVRWYLAIHDATWGPPRESADPTIRALAEQADSSVLVFRRYDGWAREHYDV